MRKTRFAALMLSGVMAASILAGCGGVNKDAVVAVFDETEVPLGVPNFAARLQQAYSDDMYNYYFGGSAWDQDLSGTGVTTQEEVKNSVMDAMFELYTLDAHAQEYGVTVSEEEQTKIAEAAAAFLAANSKEAAEELGADTGVVEEYLRLLTVQAKMREAIIADTDTNVSDAEANTSAYSYVRISKTSYTDADGNTAEYTEEELQALQDTVKAFAAEAQEKTLEEAAEAQTYTVSTGTFTAEEDSLDEAVLAALKALDEGAVSDVIDTENAYYVVRLDAKTDAEATEATRESIIREREDALYEEVLTGWQETHTWEVKEDVWKEVKFDRLFTTIEPVEETEEADVTEA